MNSNISYGLFTGRLHEPTIKSTTWEPTRRVNTKWSEFNPSDKTKLHSYKNRPKILWVIVSLYPQFRNILTLDLLLHILTRPSLNERLVKLSTSGPNSNFRRFVPNARNIALNLKAIVVFAGNVRKSGKIDVSNTDFWAGPTFIVRNLILITNISVGTFSIGCHKCR